MEILKVGDEFIVEGYQPITLTDNMESNIRAFADANAISAEQARSILATIPAMKDFAKNFTTEDIEDIVLTNFNLDEINNLEDNSKRRYDSDTKASSGKTGSTTGNTTGNNGNTKVGGSSGSGSGSTPTPKTQTLNGVTFTITNYTSNSVASVSRSGKTFTINAKNCTVTITKIAETDPQVITTGDNATFTFSCSTKKITNKAAASTINGSEGADVIDNQAQDVTINARGGNDTITNNNKKYTGVKINGGAGDDKITNKGETVTICGDNGNDTIENHGKNTTIKGGHGNDTITNKGEGSTVDGGVGNDTITNSGKKSEITGNYGSDVIKNTGAEVVIDGGKGNDSITNSGKSSTIKDLDGHNTIENKGNTTAITTGGGYDKVTNSGSETIIDTGDGNDTVTNKGAKTKIITGQGADKVTNTGRESEINTGTGNDTIDNNATKATINAGTGNDNITIKGSNNIVDGGAGQDRIINEGSATNVTKGTKDSITSKHSNTIESVAMYDDNAKDNDTTTSGSGSGSGSGSSGSGSGSGSSTPKATDGTKASTNTTKSSGSQNKVTIGNYSYTPERKTSGNNSPEKTTSGNNSPEKTTAGNNTTTPEGNTTPENRTPITATSSSTNSNELKNLLGYFNLDVNSTVSNVVTENSKIKSFVLNGKTYSVTYYTNGSFKSLSEANGNNVTTTTYHENGVVASRLTQQEANSKITVNETHYDNRGLVNKTVQKTVNGTNLATDDYTEVVKLFDAQQKTADDKYLTSTTTNTKTSGTVSTQQETVKPISEQIADATQIINETIVSLLAEAAKSFDASQEASAKATIAECIEAYKSGNISQELPNFVTTILGERGFNTSELKRSISNMNSQGLNILDSFRVITNAIKTGTIEDAAANITAPVVKTINGVNFQFTTADGSTPTHKVEVDANGYIVIEGANCTVNVLGSGESTQKVRVTGSNLTFNSNNLTLKEIINYADNSVINGSHGNDTIINQTTGNGSTINALGGDDSVTNYGINTKLNTQAGNDTIYNYASSSAIDAGDGNDAINYIEGTAQIASSNGTDTRNAMTNTPEGSQAPNTNGTTTTPGAPNNNNNDDTQWLYSQTYTENGVTFTVYSNSTLAVTTRVYNDLLTINAKNSKVVINSASNDDKYSVQFEGENLTIQNNAKLYALFNYANDTQINGSENKDYIYNYANNVVIKGNGEADAIQNKGANVSIYGNDGNDRIYVMKEASNTFVDGGKGDNTVSDNGTGTVRAIEIKAENGTQAYNMQVTAQYFTSAMNNTRLIFSEEPSDDVKNSANLLLEKLLTPANSQLKREFNDTAKELIAYAKSVMNVTAENDLEYLCAALTELDTDKTGVISTTEFDAFIDKIDVKDELDAFIANNPIITTLELTQADITAIKNSTGSAYATLNLLKRAEVILRTNNVNYTIDTIKDILTDPNLSFNNEILADAQLLLDAQESGNANQYIMDHMVKNCNNLTTAQMLEQTRAGDVVTKNGVLYVNDGKAMKQLHISAETYLELFPPVERYLVEQNDYNDCFFIATAMVDFMENGASRAKLLQMYSENDNGDITVTIPGIKNYPITFTNGQLKTTDGQFNLSGEAYSYQKIGNSIEIAEVVTAAEANAQHIPATTTEQLDRTTASLGLQMLEQAYALGKFAQLSNTVITEEDIDYYGEALYLTATDGAITAANASNVDIDKALTYYLYGGYAQEVYADLTDNDITSESYTKITSETQGKRLLSTMASILINDPNASVTTLISGNTKVSDADYKKYNIISGHQYAIERIDAINEIVYIKNPWDAYKVTAMPYDTFLNYFYGFAKTTFA